MVEMMVALVVLAVGMLGIASLYVISLRSSGSAISRMQAVNLAGELADRIRANRFARGAYMDVGVQKDCSGNTDCSQEDMAANDRFMWDRQIQALLPGANRRGAVVYTAGAANTPDNYVITVFWQEPGSDGEDANNDLSYMLTMQIDP